MIKVLRYRVKMKYIKKNDVKYKNEIRLKLKYEKKLKINET